MIKYVKSKFHPGDLVKSSHGALYIVKGSCQYLYGSAGDFSEKRCNEYCVFKVNKGKICNSYSWYTLNDCKLIKHADDEIYDMIDKYVNKISKIKKLSLKDYF